MRTAVSMLLCAVAMPTWAEAQSAPTSGQATGVQQTPTSNQSAQTAPQQTDASDDSLTGDILVTARRREERLQDVPIAVQAFSEETLQARNVVRVDDLVNTTPSFKIANTSAGRTSPSFEIRGISSVESVGAQDSPVALYVNDVYVPRPAGTNQQLFDMQNVQVLLGPQGTLFGRNATAGAIVLTANRPVDRLEAEAHVVAGNYDLRNFGGMLNLPVSDTLQVRLAGERTTRDGYTVDINTGKDYDNQNDYALRGSLRWVPASGIENIAVVDYYHSDDNGTGTVLVAARPGQPASRFYPLQQQLADQRARGIRRVAYNTDVFSKVKSLNVSNVTTVDLNDQLIVKNIAGYHYVRTSVGNDLDATILPILGVDRQGERSRSWSDELQLQGRAFDDQVTYIVGAFYFHERASFFAQSRTLVGFNPNNPGVTNSDAINESYSVFAQTTYKLPFLEGLSATAGARYTWDNRTVIANNPTIGTPPRCRLTGLPSGAPCTLEANKSFRQPTWTGSLDYKIDDRRLIYVASRRGYRSGGFNPRAFSAREAIPFSPEKVTDVELGFKGDWRLGDVKLRTNLAGYQTSYDDIQRNVSTFVDGVITTTIINAAKARIRGLEANVVLEPVRGFELSGYYGLVDAIHTRFNAVVAGQPVTLRDVPFGTARNSFGTAISLTPYDVPDKARVTFTGTYTYQDSYFGAQQLPFFEPESEVPSRKLVNFNLDIANIGGSGFAVQAFVKNAFNAKYALGTVSVQGALGVTNFIYGEPRFYGLRLSYRLN